MGRGQIEWCRILDCAGDLCYPSWNIDVMSDPPVPPSGETLAQVSNVWRRSDWNKQSHHQYPDPRRGLSGLHV